MLNVKKLLTKILSQMPLIEYVGNYGSNVYNSSWTATDNGYAVVSAGWNSSGNFAYWYVQDSTDNRTLANLGGVANGTTLSTMIPIIKGHTYTTPASFAITTANFYFYKIKLGGGTS